ncbi:BatD family protein [Dyella sp.]|uniref:BatD family protein n=1 Tax=Dyella sp. TaxID=1869338 RepID=UPI002D784EAD|nr:BatD family protein [Dyella sp.]HET6431583.1 BatD family protein [Dyella sp.]
MTRSVRCVALVLLGWLLPWLAVHAQVRATLDRSSARLGDTVTLTLHADAPLASPDLSPLQGDFEVLGRSSGSSTSIRNGQVTTDYSYGVALRPLHEGTLQIPPLTVGNQTTEALTLQVRTPDPGDPAAPNGPVFVEAAIEPDHAYVGQQLQLSVKLYFTANLANASLADPRIDGVDVSRIGGDTDYQSERNGRIYNVIERHYVLLPQREGTLDIPPVQFQGDLLDPNDPDSFLGMGAPVSARSNPLQVQVKPVPAGWGQAAWLPARQLSLQMEGLPDASRPLRVGQPFNLQMTLEATGVPFEALPALSMPALDGATAYPDKPVTGNRADGGWVVGRRQQGFAIVPDKPGTLVIPAVTVRWWNVVADRAETATIPEHRLQVRAADGSVAPAKPAPASSSSTGDSGPANVPNRAAPEASAAPAAGATWRRAALLGAGLWLITLAVLAAVWWWRRHRRRSVSADAPAPRPARALRNAFEQAVRSGDAAAQAAALLAWAQAERPSVRHLQALSEALDSPAQRDAIVTLQQARFSAHAASVDRAAVAAAFAPGLAWRAGPSAGGDGDVLAPLYPFKLH